MKWAIPKKRGSEPIAIPRPNTNFRPPGPDGAFGDFNAMLLEQGQQDKPESPSIDEETEQTLTK